ncbi:Acireductone dioxygenase ARD family [Mycena metata]|uniref:Acireductone dioxygenase n=1 Tax=Mycena metata TaxID=1033252 RepID=A0AAD7HZJ5_9AGAR|nr:Acireductone dioxygenase ARD family [Mycena metata]
MRAYYFDNLPGDQRLPHDYVPSRPVPADTLTALNVRSWKIPVDGHEDAINAIAHEQGYKSRDTVDVSREGLGDAYEQKMQGFYHEHMHEDEEIRYVLKGSGFFDVRETPTDAWIRLAVELGDLLVVPAGIYHRFTLDQADRINMLRLFQDEPKWIPHHRSAETDANVHRVGYLRSIGVGA